jgi:hypothetical protein
MSWRDAPLHAESQDLAVWVLQRVAAWPAAGQPVLAARCARLAVRLVEHVSLALSFPQERPRHLARADRCVARLREVLRLAVATGQLSAGGHRFAAGRLLGIGRMIGGWRKRVAGPSGRAAASGDGPLAARGV